MHDQPGTTNSPRVAPTRRRKRTRSTLGFTLMELLVTIGALGIIAAIAIPTFLTQRQNMFDNMAIGDAQQLRMALQARATRTNTPLTWQTGGMPSLIGEFSPTEGVQHRVFSNNLTQWCALAWHERGTLNSPENPAWVSFDTAGVNEGAPLTADICGELAEFWDDIPTPGPSDPSDPGEPSIVDTDGDGIPDDIEIELGLDPEVDQRLVLEYSTTGSVVPLVVSGGVASNGAAVPRGRTISLPVMTNANIWVDFGDGTPMRNFQGSSSRANPWTHTFTTDGVFTVTIHGDIPQFAAANSDRFSLTPQQFVGLTRVLRWEDGTETTNADRAFHNAIGLTHMVRPPESVTNMRRLMQNTPSFNGDTTNWVHSRVTTFAGIFWGSARFTGQGVSTWQTSSVSSADRAFEDAVVFNQNLNTTGNAWNVSNVSLMNNMFAGAASFSGTLNGWDTRSVVNMGNMFRDARNFNRPLNHFNTSNVTDMSHMFLAASAFNQPLSAWDTGRVGLMVGMFREATSFNGDIRNWDTSSVTTMSHVFCDAHAFNQDISGWNTANVTNMEAMFARAHAFNQDIRRSGDNWNTSNVTNMTNMFLTARSFNQNLSGWNVASVTNWAGFAANSNAGFTTARQPRFN